MKSWVARVAFASVLVVALQFAVVSNWRPAGVVIMVVWLWPVVVGVLGASPPGILAGVVAGFLFDVHVTTPLGLFTIVGLVLGYAAGQLGREGIGDFSSSAWWMPSLLAAAFGFAAPLLFIVAGFLVGDFGLWRGDLLNAMLVNAVGFAVMIRPLAFVGRRLVGDLEAFRW